jgi:hypothetical protein
MRNLVSRGKKKRIEKNIPFTIHRGLNDHKYCRMLKKPWRFQRGCRKRYLGAR